MRPIDERGWLVPRQGTKFREVYALMINGFGSREITKLMPDLKSNHVRQIVFRIKNPTNSRKRSQWNMVPSERTPPPFSR